MANKTHHIDDFLNLKLEKFEAQPDDAAWIYIAEALSHLAHPADYTINKHLSGIEGTPDPGKKDIILDDVAIYFHPIDTALHERLSVLESVPERDTFKAALDGYYRQKHKQGRLGKWVISGILFLSVIGMLVWQTGVNISGTGKNKTSGSRHSEIIQEDVYSGRKQPGENLSGVNNPHRGESWTQANKAVQPHHPSSGFSGNHITPGTYKDKMEPTTVGDLGQYFQYLADEGQTEHDYDYHCPHMGLVYFRHVYDDESLAQATKKRHPYLPRKRLSPFSFQVQVGYVYEQTVATSQKKDNIHKDALFTYRQATGHSRRGDIFSLHAGYRLNRNLIVKAGLQYSSSSTTSKISYVFREIPITDPQGVIQGYWQVPPREFSQEIKNISRSYAMPLQAYVKVLEIPKISLWSVAGIDLLIREQQGSLFSFDEAEITRYTSYRGNISPHIGLMTEYVLRPGLSLTGNLQCSFMEESLKFERARFVRQQLIPSLRFGILYSPIIEIK